MFGKCPAILNSILSTSYPKAESVLVNSIIASSLVFMMVLHAVIISHKMGRRAFTESAEKLSIAGKVRAIPAIVPGRRGGV